MTFRDFSLCSDPQEYGFCEVGCLRNPKQYQQLQDIDEYQSWLKPDYEIIGDSECSVFSCNNMLYYDDELLEGV